MSTPSAAERRLENILKIVVVAIVTDAAPADEDMAALKAFAEIDDAPPEEVAATPDTPPPADPVVAVPPADPVVETPTEIVPDPQPTVSLADVAPEAATGDLSA